MLKPIAAAIAAAILAAPLAGAQTLRIGLAEDPDVLDPTLARTFVGRIVFAGLCDKLVDIDKDLKIIPQLATSWEWSKDQKSLTMKIRQGVTFHDGEKLDAAAVKFNIERHKTMQGSNRRGELAPVTGVDVVDPYTVRSTSPRPSRRSSLNLRTARDDGLAEGAQAAGEKFSAHPVCAGPSSSSIASPRERSASNAFPNYWNKGAIHFDKVTYEPVVDPTARLASLKSGSSTSSSA
jgi:peptide/nickel transport system substrate-binding protein